MKEIVLSDLDKESVPVIKTKLGDVRGLRASDGNYDMYMGIPYGKIQYDKPFGEALPHPKFERTFDATDDSAISPQEEEFSKTIVGELDCLHLNIYVPNHARSVKRPVMVWIFGGRYEIGFPGRYVYGPKYFIKQDVILVSVNYRLGPYGFMCANTAEVPGNQGLKDILLSLKWIKHNIHSFGGDDENITLFGESSGAVAIDLFLKHVNDLFHKVILMSAVATRPLTVRLPDLTVPTRIATQLGFEPENLDEAIKFLSKIEPLLVIKAYLELGIIFRPCVKINFKNTLIPDFPMNLPLPNLKGVPIMIGFCDSETMFRHYHKSEEDFRECDVFTKYLSTTFDFSKELKDTVDIVKQFYIGNREICKDLLWEVIDFDSDFSFIYPIKSRIEEYLHNGANKIYQYMFTYNGDRNFVKKRANIKEGGACHADDIAYLFDISYEGTPSEPDQLMIERMTSMWANFAKYGEPNPKPSPLLPETWHPVTQTDDHCMVIDRKLSPITSPLHNRMMFWRLFYEAHRKKLRFM